MSVRSNYIKISQNFFKFFNISLKILRFSIIVKIMFKFCLFANSYNILLKFYKISSNPLFSKNCIILKICHFLKIFKSVLLQNLLRSFNFFLKISKINCWLQNVPNFCLFFLKFEGFSVVGLCKLVVFFITFHPGLCFSCKC